MKLYAQVALPLPLYSNFTYRVPPEIQEFIRVGMAVEVPFRQSEILGVVVNLKNESDVKERQVKDIQEIIYPDFFLSPAYLSFTRRLADYFLVPWGEILELAFPHSLGHIQQKRVKLTVEGQRLTNDSVKKLNTQEKRILEFVSNKDYSLIYLKRKFKGVDVASVVSRLKRKGLMEVFVTRRSRPSYNKIKTEIRAIQQLTIPFLSGEKTNLVFQAIIDKSTKSSVRQFYLHGSEVWRHEIYSLLVENIARKENQVIVLVPEISQVAKLASRLQERLGEEVFFFHSQLPPGKIWSTWKGAVEGRAKIIVGTRSALFLPCAHLALIIVDDESASTYYQIEKPRYDPCVGAWLRGEEEKAGVVFGGSIPRVETYYKCQMNGFIFQEEVKKEYSRQVIIDEFISEKKLFSPKLKKRLQQAAENKQQCLLFYNRLGRSSLFFCPACRLFLQCPECGEPLVRTIKDKKVVRCLLGHVKKQLPLRCPRCQRVTIEYKGYGINHVIGEAKMILPQAKIDEVSSESPASRKKLNGLLSKFAKKKIDLLIGTEMILHLPLERMVDLAVALRPEIALELPDFDTSQKMYQSLNKLKQFLRSASRSELWIQTGLPEHHAFQALKKGDYNFFYEKELELRQMMHLPPYSRVVQVFFWGKSLSQLGKESRAFLAYLRKRTKIDWVGPNVTFHPQRRKMKGIQLLLRIPPDKFDSIVSVLKDYFRKKNLSPWVKVQG